ncbi:Isochorismatase-like protein [Pterulicium gracile]|uniref:Isochorismatase-like protein n=1 Tax=Pterulicium gracile TaxID=1884261 RepID=A0A5C3QF19_9AGAR|nr:Isochorismatase-like protein [Pterula gracilis]
MSFLNPKSTILLVCDLQLRFRSAICGFDHVVATANKMVKVAKLVGCEVVASEQKAQVFGPTVPEVGLDSLGPVLITKYDKTLFSMLTKDLDNVLEARPSVKDVILLGIESHVCVLQTALDLRARGMGVHVLSDGVSSINRQEVAPALELIRQHGGFVTTSESISFRLMRDASASNFKDFANLIKEEKERTKSTMEALSS